MRSRTTWKRGLEAGLWGVILFRLTGMGRLVPVGGHHSLDLDPEQ